MKFLQRTTNNRGPERLLADGGGEGVAEEKNTFGAEPRPDSPAESFFDASFF